MFAETECDLLKHKKNLHHNLRGRHSRYLLNALYSSRNSSVMSHAMRLVGHPRKARVKAKGKPKVVMVPNEQGLMGLYTQSVSAKNDCF